MSMPTSHEQFVSMPTSHEHFVSMPTSHERFMSMSTPHEHFMSMSHDQAAVLYVVSRSGKVLKPEDRSQRFVEGNYFEGELEGWIFWGSSKRSTGNSGIKQREDAGGSGAQGIIGNPFDSLGRVPWKRRIPFVVWGNEADSIHDVFSSMSWRQIKSHGRKISARRINAEAWKDANAVFQTSFSACFKPQDLYRSNHWCSMERNYKIGLSQLAILQQSDVGSRWEPGTREVAARWAAWLLKMLRKTRPRPLQHLLFTMCSAMLPVICCSLAREQWSRVPDEELCRCVDIVWGALDKSYACFTPVQWEILEEGLIECRRLRMKVGSLADKDPQAAAPVECLEGSPYRLGRHPNNRTSTLRRGASQESHQPCFTSRDEKLSNNLVEKEGVSALVKRALCDKLFTPRSRNTDGNGAPDISGGLGTIVSLVCPLSGRRVKVPARGRSCSHPTSFDLQSFLEERANNDSRRRSSVHQRKKPKTGVGAWCCPICGSDATWPQIVVDKRLLRILDVLPKHMLQVCLLPNGRWRVVWSAGGDDSGQIDAKLTELAVRPPFTSGLNSEIYGIGQFEDFGRDSLQGQDEACGCREVQILHRAYKAWKDGVDHHVGQGGTTEHMEMQWGSETTSTVAVWTGDRNSSRESLWQASTQSLFDLGETRNKARSEFTHSVSNAEAEVHPVMLDDLVKITSVGSEAVQETPEHEDETRIASESKLCEALQALGGITSVCDMTGGMYARMRVGQARARPKLKAKKV